MRLQLLEKAVWWPYLVLLSRSVLPGVRVGLLVVRLLVLLLWVWLWIWLLHGRVMVLLLSRRGVLCWGCVPLLLCLQWWCRCLMWWRLVGRCSGQWLIVLGRVL